MFREIKMDGIGFAKIEPDTVIAGSRNTLILTYYVGKKGLKKGGTLRVTVPHGFTPPQIDEFYRDGFVTVECSESGVSISMGIVSKIFCAYNFSLAHTGAFGKSLFIHLDNGELFEGNIIKIKYGNVSYYGEEPWGPKPPRAPELSGMHEFTIAVDPDGSRSAPATGYFLIPRSPVVNVLPDKPEKLIPIAPSNAQPDKKSRLYVITVDQYLNPVKTERGEIVIKARHKAIVSYSSRRGITLTPEKLNKNYTVYVVKKTGENEISGRSNPVRFSRYMGKEHLFWGDIHTHSSYSDGMGRPEDVLSYARDIAGLDFAAVTDHDDIGPYISAEEWEQTKRVTREINKPGVFVTFLGYEYRSDLADMNVYYPGDEGLLMCGKKEEWDTPAKIVPFLIKHGAMIIPHMHFGADWRGYDPNVFRVMEIYSQHGSAEYIGCPRQIPYLTRQLQKGSEGNINATFREMLALGMKPGVTAGSDSHCGRPWLSNWTRVTRTYNGGLTAVFAKNKTRDEIWNALIQRHCYGTTGTRIYLEFSINGKPMGSELIAKRRKIYVYCIGTCSVLRVEVIKNNRVMRSVDSSDYECFFLIDDTPENREDIYYIRVVQEDKEMAWSSPVWVK